MLQESRFEKIVAGIILALPVIYLMVLQYLGAHAFHIVHDNMDSEISFRLVLKYAGILFSTANDVIVPNVMQDLPRNALNASSFTLISWLFAFLEPLRAYQVNEILVRVVGLVGTYLFCIRLLLPRNVVGRYFIASVLASSFALSQGYMMYGLSVYGVPLLVVFWHRALTQEGTRSKILASIMTISYGFYSSLVLFGYVVIVLGTAFALVLWFHKRRHEAYVIASLVGLLGFTYLLSEQNLFKLFLFGRDFISHRSDYNVMTPNFYRVANGVKHTFFRTLFFGHYHTSYASLLPIVVSAIAIGLSFYNRKKEKLRALLIALGVGVILSAIQALSYSYLYAQVRQQSALITMFGWERFFFGLPVAWTIVFALAIIVLLRLTSRPWLILIPLLSTHLVYSAMGNAELRANVTQVIHGGWPSKEIFMPSFLKGYPKLAGLFGSRPLATWEQFYAEDLFRKIDHDFPFIKKEGRVGSLGFYPSIPQYNGFRTIDGYQNNYALSYKKRFRKVVEGELDLSKELTDYFDGWGSRCFLISREYFDKYPLKGLYILGDSLRVHDFHVSPQAFHEVGGTHLMSSMEIVNAPQIGLELLGHYQEEHTPLHVYLYLVKDAPSI